jgi:hypothetical protein
MYNKTQFDPQTSLPWRMTRFALCSMAGGALLGFVVAMLFMAFGALVIKDRFIVGGGPDPVGVGLMFAIVFGGLGTALGTVIGVIGAAVIFFTRR